MTRAAQIMVGMTTCWGAWLAAATAQENLAPLGAPLIGVGANLNGTSDVTVDHFGPADEVNDGVFNSNLAPNGFQIDADGQAGANGNGVDTFAGGISTGAFDFVGVQFADPQYGVTAVRVQNFLANDGGWWGPTNVVAGGAPLTAGDLAAPTVQVRVNGAAAWTTVSTLTSDYVSQYTGVLRGSGFPNATSGPFATFSFAEQNGVTAIRLIGSGDGPADGNGFIGVNEFEVIGAANELTLEVNVATGAVQLRNLARAAIAFDFYRITSPSGGLNLAGWNSLENLAANPPGFPSGSGVGNGWEELGNLTDTLVAEAYLQGSSSLPTGGSLNLGRLFAGGPQDLALRYRTAGGVFVDVPATYVSSGYTADFDLDGDVDAADLAAWRQSAGVDLVADADGDGDSDGVDFLRWQQQLGATNGGPATSAAPEPAHTVLLIGLMAAWRSLSLQGRFTEI